MTKRAGIYFAALTVAFFAPLLWGDAFLPTGFLFRTPPWYDPRVPLLRFDMFDAVIYTYPVQALFKQALSEGHFLFWNPYNLGGHPIAFDGALGLFYPPRILLLALFPAWLAHGLSLAIHTFVAGFGGFLLARRLGLSGLASTLTGTAWMFNPFVMGWLEVDSIAICAAYTPLGLLAVDRCRKDWRGCAYLTACVGLLLVCGHLQLVLYSLCTIALVGLLMLKVRGCPVQVWPRLIVAGIGGLLLAAPMLLPASHYMSHSQRPTLKLEFLTGIYRQFLATVPANLLFPQAYGDGNEFAVKRIMGAGEFIEAELCIYFGVITLLLALASVQGPGMGRWLVLGALIVIVVPATPLYGLVRMLPGFERINSTRTLQILHFFVVLAAGFGFDKLSSQKSRLRTTGLAVAMLIAGASWMQWASSRSAPSAVKGLLSEGRLRLPPRELFYTDEAFLEASVRGFQSLYSWSNLSVWLPLLTLLVAAIALQFGKKGQICLVALLTIDLFVTGRIMNPHHPRPLLYQQNATISQLMEASPDRVMGVGTIKPSTLLPFQIQDIAGYSPFYPQHTGEYLAYVMRGSHMPERQLPAQVFPIKRYRTPLVDLLGVKYLVAYPGMELEGYPLVQPAPLPIFENPKKFPRAFLVNQYTVVGDSGEALESLENGQVDPRREVILTRDPGLKFDSEHQAEAVVAITDYGWNEVRLNVESEKGGLLVLTDSFVDGWIAKVGGKPTEVMRADVMFRAIEVPPGQHEVSFEFHPVRFRVGLGLSVFALLLVLALFVFGAAKPAPETSPPETS